MSVKPILSEKNVTMQEIYDRQSDKEILATTALYGPWKPDGTFDWSSYENLVKDVVQNNSVPATNVDTTWAIYNDWDLTKNLIWHTAKVAEENRRFLADERPLVVAGLNTNAFDINLNEIAPTLARQIAEIDEGLKERGLTRRIRYMPVPDKRLYHASLQEKVGVYKQIGKVIEDFTDHGMVFFELDIGIPGFGSNFNVKEIESILAETRAIQEYKSALISQKSGFRCVYDFCDDILRINIVERVAPQRIQYSTGNDWFIALARYGKYLDKHGYLLGASQISPILFKLWREFVKAEKSCSLAIEQDLQAAAKDFWTPGNVGIYRHYLAIFLAFTGHISHALPHPRCAARYRVRPENYFIPLKHAIRLGLVDKNEAKARMRHIIPGCRNWTDEEIRKRLEYMS